MVHSRFNKPQKEKPQVKEEYAVILDVVVTDKHSFKDSEVAQAIGTTHYGLLELVPKEGVILQPNQKVYIGEGKRDEIQYIKKTLRPDKLTRTAYTELPYTLEEIVKEKEEEFVNFFNTAGPITIRKHSFELIPGIGKKHLKELIDERDSKPFESFEDIKKRCSFIHEPEKAIAKRIMNELEGKDDFKFFTQK